MYNMQFFQTKSHKCFTEKGKSNTETGKQAEDEMYLV